MNFYSGRFTNYFKAFEKVLELRAEYGAIAIDGKARIRVSIYPFLMFIVGGELRASCCDANQKDSSNGVDDTVYTTMVQIGQPGHIPIVLLSIRR